ncbi:MAG TPA: von Willebrand factor type A domain-containing protein [Vicinamibacteria bacterium]|nr:von Willebrand factor type A domain-containing protein [Vicinamibacteria bacterium]
MRNLLVVSLALLTAAGPAGGAGVAHGTVEGVVVDSSGAALPGVTVQLVMSAGTRTTVSDATGAFRFSGVPTGRQRLRVHLSGFLTLESDVVVRTGATEHVRLELRIAALEEVVTVTAATPVVDTMSASYALSPLEADTESYRRIDEAGFLSPFDRPLSTVSIDVDTASYANVRRFILDDHRLPPADAVRIEEMLNYFRYSYEEPSDARPLAVSTEVADCPWARGHLLVRIGLQARRASLDALPPRNLVFLVDVSGSMNSPDKLPLVKAGLRLLASQLGPRDSVAIVVYAGASGLVLPPTSGERRGEILAALDQLEAGGSTNGGEGIRLAYDVAQRSFVEGGINRVVLATDGDFNVGTTSEGELSRLIEAKRRSGVFLSVLGFGTGNLKDATMEMLADRGDGNFAYIDSLAEARKVLVTEAGGTLVTVARDVKMQVEWNPARVARYRLIGYENRVLADEAFEDDQVDAGEAGAGHSVTFLYEAVPAGDAETSRPRGLRYQAPRQLVPASHGDELLSVKVRFKPAAGGRSRSLDAALRVRDSRDEPSTDLRFSAAVAAFGMLLRGSEWRGEADYGLVTRLATEGQVEGDETRKEFLALVAQARALANERPGEGSR